ncbi:MAG: NAD(P)H-hydrate dehydratase [Candidatus Micrarchaeota archaeon]|nr:NAD(P)H-hydrate dehydratase [Candidatus Micrarchaeota archaeon]MDE1823887.1 NAD(P)H-hydrate dehydratase [Candidatus Micrarchaeota archaeon]MDE1849301.1 NAD(P)H-hydrate dehydratase [Candidatus Micrarchaeota archaeon]
MPDDVKNSEVKVDLASEADLSLASAPRSVFSDKATRGIVLVIGGSDRLYGAPVLASKAAYNSLAALRTASGYAKTYVPRDILALTRGFSPNMVVNALGSKSIVFNSAIKREIEKSDAIAIGMGIGRKSAALRAAYSIIKHGMAKGKKMIVDADAIGSVKGRKLSKDVVITPHEKEFLRLSGLTVSKTDIKDRAAKAMTVSRKLNANVLLKGHYTIITDGTRAKVSIPKAAALATMGTGDVLSGMIAAFASAGAPVYEAAVAGAYLHGRIGDLLFEAKGNHVIASDVIDMIPSVLKKYDKTIGR